MNIKYIITLLTFYLLVISCEKIIDLDLNDVNPLPVFEAHIENDSFCYVQATWTSSYYNTDSALPITNAVITISDQLGGTETLVYQGNGLYQGMALKGVMGNHYTLSVAIDDKTYKAESTMPNWVPIDSLTLQDLKSFYGGNWTTTQFIVHVNYTDPVDVANYYATRIHSTRKFVTNPEPYTSAHHVENDELANGISTRFPSSLIPFESGDSLTVEFASIDKATYLYFKTLKDAVYGGGVRSATPSNPTTNFSKGALGYFSAWSKDRMKYTLP